MKRTNLISIGLFVFILADLFLMAPKTAFARDVMGLVPTSEQSQTMNWIMMVVGLIVMVVPLLWYFRKKK
ncbi:MAG: LPXTG cell wall anchor domain-containing protein [Anaerolineales bacterium]